MSRDMSPSFQSFHLNGRPGSHGFEYHKEPFPPDWRHDALTVGFRRVWFFFFTQLLLGGAKFAAFRSKI